MAELTHGNQLVVRERLRVGGRAEGGDRGFPLYLDDQFFVSLKHPSGFARMENGEVVLRQYPGLRLAPGQRLSCMEAVYGVAKPGEIHASFVSYVRSRMRRVVRGHDKPYAVLESFGGQLGVGLDRTSSAARTRSRAFGRGSHGTAD